MSSLRKKAVIRLVVCAVFLIASIVFSVLLLTGTFDGDTAPAADPSSTSESVDTSTSDSSCMGHCMNIRRRICGKYALHGGEKYGILRTKVPGYALANSRTE